MPPFQIKMKVRPPIGTWTSAQARVRQATFEVFRVFAVDIVANIKPNISIKSGQLARSLFARADWESNEPVLRAGMGKSEDGRVLRYARQWEEGGDIVARNVKYLTIPMGELATPSGVEGFSAAMARTMFKWTWVMPDQSGRNLYIWGRNQGGPLTALFLLKERVHQEGHHVFFPEIERQIPRIRRGIRLAARNAILGRDVLAVRQPGE